MTKSKVYGLAAIQTIQKMQRIRGALSYEECLQRRMENFYAGMEYFGFLALLARLSKSLPGQVAEMRMADILYYLRQLKKEHDQMQKSIEEMKKGK